MAVTGLITKAPVVVEQKTERIYLHSGVATLSTWNRSAPIKCYPGTCAIIAMNEDGTPKSGWVDSLEGEWSTAKIEPSATNQDVHVLDSGEAKFSAGRAHVVGLPGSVVVVAVEQDMSGTTGVWSKMASGAVKAAKPAKAGKDDGPDSGGAKR